MAKSKSIIITESDIEEFLKDIPKNSDKFRGRVYTDFEQKVIITAFENNYTLSAVAERLKTTPRVMKKFYESYKAGRA
jgi:hypothetical protein